MEGYAIILYFNGHSAFPVFFQAGWSRAFRLCQFVFLGKWGYVMKNSLYYKE